MTPLGIGIVALLGAGIGFLLGGLVMSLRSRQVKPPAQKPDSPGVKEADPNLEEITRLWFDRRNRYLVVEVEGQQYRSATQLDDARRRRVQAGLNGLRSWLGAAVLQAEQAPAPEASRPSTPPSPPPEPAKTGFPGQASGTLAPGEPRATVMPPAPEVKPVKTNLLDAASKVLTPRVSAPQYRSIASQINDILQEKLHGTPLVERGIVLMETPDQGVVVMVGMEKYPGVDAVPDPEIRRVLQEAAAEWERRSRKQA